MVRSKRGRSKARSSSRVAKRTRKTVARRGVSRSRVARAMNTHSFSRYCPRSSFPNIDCITSTLGTGWEFRLADVVNYAEFTTLFDRFMLTKVVVTLRLVTNPNASAVLNTTSPAQISNWFPQLWYVYDYDDSSAETLDSIKERIGVKCRVLKPDRSIRIVIRPRFLVQTYVTPIATGYAPRRGYVDCNQPSMVHYGLKTVVDTMGLDPNDLYPFTICQERQYFFSLKDVR